MTTAIASGLGESFGFAKESTVGTYDASGMRWIMHDKAEFMLKKHTAQSQALNGTAFEMANRRRLTSYTVDGSLEYELQDKQFGLLFQMMLGANTSACAPVQIESTTAYTQTFIPALLEGLSLTGQKGVPETSGTVVAFSETGLKITDWEIAVAVDEIAKMAFTLDGWNEVTNQSFVAPSYLTGASAPNLLAFNDGSLLIGGTVSTSDGITTVSDGAATTGLVKSVSIKGSNKVKQDRYYLGSQIKAEQISNAFRPITGEIEIEWATAADFYTDFVSDEPTTLQFSLVSPVEIGSSGSYGTVSVILPSIRWEGETPNANGPEVITVKVPFTALLDQEGDPIIQVQYISSDTTT
jgi:hypothetical protein